MFPVTESNVLPCWLFESLQDDLQSMQLNNRSSPGNPVFWGMDKPDSNTRGSMLASMSYAMLRAQKHVPYHLEFKDIMVNGSTSNQPGGRFHVDVSPEYYGPDFTHITAVLYTAPEWNTQWGGETVVRTPDGSYSYSTYIPNKMVIFPSSWDHYGASPTDACPILRTSLGFGFEVCYNSPIAR